MVDGASSWQRFTQIALPLLRPILALAIALRAIDSFKSLDLVYVLTRGGPASATETVGFLTYLNGFTYFDLGLTAAMSVVQVIIVTVVFRLAFPRIYRAGAGPTRAVSS
jgi:multiple sugar transport system permease protein